MNSRLIGRYLRPVYMILLALFLALPASLGSVPSTAHAALSSIVNDDFNVMPTGSFPTGWTMENGAGGTVTVQEFPSASDKSMKLNDTSTSANVIVNKPFMAPEGLPMTVEFDIYPSQTNMFIAAGYILNNSGTDRANTVYFDSSGSQIVAWDGSATLNLQSYTASTWYHMKYVMDFNTKKYDVYINGVLKANNLGFNGSPQAGSKIQFFTGTSQTGSVYVNNAQVSTGGMLKLSTNKVFDDFNGMTSGSAPTGWSIDSLTGGTATVENVPSSTDKSVKLNHTSTVSGQFVKISKSFTPVTYRLTAEFEVMLGQTNVVLSPGYVANSSGTIAVRPYFDSGGQIYVYNGATAEVVQTYEANKWYRIKFIIEVGTGKFDVFVNGALKKSGVSFYGNVTSLSNINFDTWHSAPLTATMYVDNVNISSEGELEANNYGSTYNYTGNPIGGAEGYSKLVNSWTTLVTTASGLQTALSNAVSGDTIYIDDNVDLNFDTYTLPLEIKGGVTLASGRGKIINGTLSQGARVTANVPGKGLFKVTGDNVRVTGLRIDGRDYIVGTQSYVPDITHGIYTEDYGTTEIDNNEIMGWSWAGVAMNDGYVHHNYIHQNRRYGLGYGIVQEKSTLNGIMIEGNLMDYNQHSIASTGEQTTKYEAKYNTVLHFIEGHAFDMHRNLACMCAGDWIKIHHNTFQDLDSVGRESVMIRSVPQTGAYIELNWFYNPDSTKDVVQANVSTAQRFNVGSNKYGTGTGIQYLTNKYGLYPNYG